MDHVVCDIEIKKTIEETPGGWDATHLLGVSVAVVYEMEEDRYTIYGPEDVEALQQRLFRADRITTFNGWRFDFPVIWGYSRPQWDGWEMEVLPTLNPLKATLRERSDDLLRRIWQGLGLNPDVFTRAHGGWGLDDVCLATLGRGKTGHGADAPKLYQAGRWVELINYCLEDVRLTRDLLRSYETNGCVRGPKGRVTLEPWRHPLGS